MKKLASSPINQLICSLNEEVKAALIELLGSRENFKNLNFLCSFGESDEKFIKRINQIRPNITVILTAEDSDSESETNFDPEIDS